MFLQLWITILNKEKYTEPSDIFSNEIMESKSPESVLGKRIFNYLKNEALIGRISKQKLQVKMLSLLRDRKYILCDNKFPQTVWSCSILGTRLVCLTKWEMNCPSWRLMTPAPTEVLSCRRYCPPGSISPTPSIITLLMDTVWPVVWRLLDWINMQKVRPVNQSEHFINNNQPIRDQIHGFSSTTWTWDYLQASRDSHSCAISISVSSEAAGSWG